jgi:hypothetical protein
VKAAAPTKRDARVNLERCRASPVFTRGINMSKLVRWDNQQIIREDDGDIKSTVEAVRGAFRMFTHDSGRDQRTDPRVEQ